MNKLFIRELKLEDKEKFLSAMQLSKDLHYPWVKAPLSSQEFDDLYQGCQKEGQRGFLVCLEDDMVGVFIVSGIARGAFQSAYLGFYAVAAHAGKGYMSAGLKLVLERIFHELKLHRIEANIQPENHPSLRLVKQNGFRFEGFAPHYLKIYEEWKGHEHWAMTIEDYPS